MVKGESHVLTLRHNYNLIFVSSCPVVLGNVRSLLVVLSPIGGSDDRVLGGQNEHVPCDARAFTHIRHVQLPLIL